ncbi:MAG TPA: YciK family oxidoreductase [Pseudomonadaceae bacterium]|nr:YciK family oxidoreductase [Pseudomonadaceae bacterium]
MLAYHAPPDLLQDRNILITGAGSGLGRAAALACAAHGATVLLLGRTEEKLDATYDAILAAGGKEPALFVLDLQRAGDADYQQLREILATEFGVLHGLLHSAAANSPALPLEHLDLGTWNQLLQVNLSASFALTVACLPLLKLAEHASIVFTSAREGRQARAFRGAYAVSKHGVETLMAIFAEELQNTSGVRVNSLDPGPCATALRKVVFPSEDPSTLPSPESLMPLYLYLMGDDSLQQTGKRFAAQEDPASA